MPDHTTDPSTNHAQSPGPCAIVVARYNESITSVMRQGAIESYLKAGGSEDTLAVIEAPGAYELVAVANAAARSGMYESVVCLGCVIKGETTHDHHIAAAVGTGLTQITIETGIPVAFGVLTTNTIEQAQARAGGSVGNKGAEAMDAVLGARAAILAIEHADTPGINFVQSTVIADKASSTPHTPTSQGQGEGS